MVIILANMQIKRSPPTQPAPLFSPQNTTTSIMQAQFTQLHGYPDSKRINFHQSSGSFQRSQDCKRFAKLSSLTHSRQVYMGSLKTGITHPDQFKVHHAKHQNSLLIKTDGLTVSHPPPPSIGYRLLSTLSGGSF